MKYNWIDENEYPFKSNYFEINGVKQHFIDEGEGDILLFVHGTPSWSFDFRHIIKEFSKTNRCIAIDHVGFGLSDKPENYDYSTQNHSQTLIKFIEYLGLKNITLIVHDFGGPIGINYAVQNPDNITQICIINSWLWDSTKDPHYIKFEKILKNPLLPFLYKYFNFSPKFVLPSSFGKNKIKSKILKHYTKPFENKTQRNGTIAFAKSLLNDQIWFEEIWKKSEILKHKPVLFIWGMKDPVIPPHYLEKFRERFRNSMVKKIMDAGHFPQEEYPDEVIKALKEFLF